jgi:secreted PhoX family phosphatase
MNRRHFLQFLGVSGVLSSLPGCSTSNFSFATPELPGLSPSLLDQVQTASGIDHKILIRWGDKINPKETFGFNNDFIAIHPLENDRALLWVNHEYVSPLFINGPERTKENVDKELKEVGGSILEIKKQNQTWNVVNDSQYNRRLDANTKIPFAWHEKIAGKDYGVGTMGN